MVVNLKYIHCLSVTLANGQLTISKGYALVLDSHSLVW